MLRSEDMEYYNIYVGKDCARNAVAELGKTEIVQFVNLNTNKSLSNSLFNKEIRYLEKMKLKLNAIINEIEKRGVDLGDLFDTDLEISDVDFRLEKAYLRLQNLKEVEAETDEYLQKLREDLFVLRECEMFFGEDSAEGKNHVFRLGHLVGVISKEKSQLFDSVAQSSLKRNFVIHKNDFSANQPRTCYIVLTHGEESLARTTKIFSSLGGRVYNMEDEKYRERAKGVLTITSLISQIARVSKNNKEALKSFLASVAKQIRNWRFVISKEIEIFKTLNYFHNYEEAKSGSDETNIIGEAWVPRKYKKRFEACVKHVNENLGWVSFERATSTECPPTFIITNEYTDAFQQMNNMFEVPSYKEINPGIFVLFAFPALFGIMFADALHGLILVALSLALVFFGPRFAKKSGLVPGIVAALFPARFVILSAGVAAVYCGLLFNEFGSVAIPFFPSKFVNGAGFYPFGIDWGWRHAKNKAEFYNNLKMKMAVIVGTVHMGFGVALAYANALATNNRVKIYTEIIPQSIVFFSFNGYVVFLIFYKWLAKANAPLIEVLIDMYAEPFKSTTLYPGQDYVQRFLLSAMATCVLWLFASKPFYFIFVKKKKIELSSFFIEHFIHTMEFGVGIVSNTASYLRLWAVSLAHATLTEILHDSTFGKSVILGCVLFPVYAIFAVVLLCGMEGISAALHALRLNWIEFGLKFSHGKGNQFLPLVFREVADDD